MRESSLAMVVAIEQAIYEFPWTYGNFADSLRAGYSCWEYWTESAFVGYSILMLAPDEAHLLNLSVAQSAQRRGYGSRMLEHVIGVARDHRAQRILLEVRPSNAGAQALYAGFGFDRIGVRRGYYPAARGREDAIVLARTL
jgi:[ribosomal protein S18]-alanine N-acetyltransferase